MNLRFNERKPEKSFEQHFYFILVKQQGFIFSIYVYVTQPSLGFLSQHLSMASVSYIRFIKYLQWG